MPNEPVTLSQLENRGETVKVCGLDVPVREWTHGELNYYGSLEDDLKTGLEAMTAKLDAARDKIQSYEARLQSVQVREKKLMEAAKKAEVNLDLDDEEGWTAYESLLERRERAQEKMRDLESKKLRQVLEFNQVMQTVTLEVQEARRRMLLDMCVYLSSGNAPKDWEAEMATLLDRATPTDFKNAERVVEEGKVGWGITPQTTETDSSTSQTDGTNTVITPPHSRQELPIDDSGI